MRHRVSRGFTLIEVLIASVILFAVITVVSESYRASLAASGKSRSVVDIAAVLPLIVGHIREVLRSDPQESVSGDGRVLGVDYAFTAESMSFKPPPARFDPDSGQFREYPARYRLYAVRLDLQTPSGKRTFEFKEVAWVSNVRM